MAEASTDTEQRLDEYMAIWNERDYSKIPDVISESFVRMSPVAGEDVKGHDGLEEFLRSLEASFSDFQVSHEEQLIGEDIVMFESTFTGTHDGEFNDVPPTNEKVELSNMSILQLEDGRIREHRTYYDPQVFAEQLGVTDR
jgi:steroid delta-isomerase-like uncharacterized protein